MIIIIITILIIIIIISPDATHLCHSFAFRALWGAMKRVLKRHEFIDPTTLGLSVHMASTSTPYEQCTCCSAGQCDAASIDYAPNNTFAMDIL